MMLRLQLHLRLRTSFLRGKHSQDDVETAAPPPAPNFFLGGKHSQDDVETAAARQKEVNIRRRHRLADRHHEERSPSPSLNTLIFRAKAARVSLEPPVFRPLTPSPVLRTITSSPAPPELPAPSQRSIHSSTPD